MTTKFVNFYPVNFYEFQVAWKDCVAVFKIDNSLETKTINLGASELHKKPEGTMDSYQGKCKSYNGTRLRSNRTTVEIRTRFGLNSYDEDMKKLRNGRQRFLQIREHRKRVRLKETQFTVRLHRGILNNSRRKTFIANGSKPILGITCVGRIIEHRKKKRMKIGNIGPSGTEITIICNQLFSIRRIVHRKFKRCKVGNDTLIQVGEQESMHSYQQHSQTKRD